MVDLLATDPYRISVLDRDIECREVRRLACRHWVALGTRDERLKCEQGLDKLPHTSRSQIRPLQACKESRRMSVWRYDFSERCTVQTYSQRLRQMTVLRDLTRNLQHKLDDVPNDSGEVAWRKGQASALTDNDEVGFA